MATAGLPGSGQDRISVSNQAKSASSDTGTTTNTSHDNHDNHPPLLDRRDDDDDDDDDDDAAFTLNPDYAYQPRKLKVFTIGAGFSGLLMAHKFQHRFPDLQDVVDHTIFEARSEVGGTWSANDYPGVQCDVPAHIYAFPFDPNPDWTRFYASGAEILAYMKRTVKKWNLDRDLQLNTKVVGAEWQQRLGQWKVTVEDTTTTTTASPPHPPRRRIEFCHVLISAQGVLVHEAWPQIPGLSTTATSDNDSSSSSPNRNQGEGIEEKEEEEEEQRQRRFQGHVVHSARWDHSYDYAGKRIAVIGNGSSGIQLVPQLAALPGTVVQNFVRGPAWVYYRAPPSVHLGRRRRRRRRQYREGDDDDEDGASNHDDDDGDDDRDDDGDDGDPNPRYTDEERRRFRHDPVAHWTHRKGIVARTNRSFYVFRKGAANTEAMRRAAAHMADKLGHDPRLCEMLIPRWELGCRRITPGPGYLEAFRRANCALTNSAITAVGERGIHTADGAFFECDAIVCATGFDVSHRPRYPIVGQSGVDLASRWADDPDSYLSVAVPDYPNYFMLMGPNCLGGHGSLVESLNWTGDYVAKWVRKMATEDICAVQPKRAVCAAFVRYSDQIHQTLVWTGGCASWYKRHREGTEGRVTALFGGSAHLFQRLLREIRGEDWEIAYRTANPLRFMGNGFTAWEMDPASDLAWYVEQVGHGGPPSPS